jgi:hypothetical protein
MRTLSPEATILTLYHFSEAAVLGMAVLMVVVAMEE